jgi:hypothetical protein
VCTHDVFAQPLFAAPIAELPPNGQRALEVLPRFVDPAAGDTDVA